MTKIGTHHFQSLKAARSYYNKQGYDKEYVQDAIDDGSIVIGKPPSRLMRDFLSKTVGTLSLFWRSANEIL